MKALLLLLSLLFVFSEMSHAQMIEEKQIDFTISPAIIHEGNSQVAFSWLAPHEFRTTNLSVTDVPKISEMFPGKMHIVASKMAFISKRPYEQLAHSALNNAEFISLMLDSVSIKNKEADLWNVTNRVVVYRIPFRVSFDFRFKEVSAQKLGSAAETFMKDEAAGFKGTGKDRFLTLDMTNFSQLLFRNYALVYLKELSDKETLVVATVVTGFDLQSANSYFQHPPFSTTKGQVLPNLREQILRMIKVIKQ